MPHPTWCTESGFNFEFNPLHRSISLQFQEVQKLPGRFSGDDTTVWTLEKSMRNAAKKRKCVALALLKQEPGFQEPVVGVAQN